ncbi:MAG: hypothetical protein IMX01_08450 [Limnochordaceae bacterium]|nr:hypothetical protein [Limnochordaceae bacterium]
MANQSRTWNAFAWLVATLVVTGCVGPVSPVALAAGLSIDGFVQWSARYPMGESQALADAAGFGLSAAPNRLQLQQQVHLSLSGDILPGTTIRADLDNARGDNLQLLAVDLQRSNLRLHLGDLRLESDNPFTIYNLSLKGVSLEYRYRNLLAQVVAARWQGIPASRTFVGGWSTDSLLLVNDGPSVPMRQNGELVASLAGLPAAALAWPGFDPGFMQVFIQYCDSFAGGAVPPTLAQFLEENGLDFLYQHAGGGPDDPGVIQTGSGLALPDGSYAVLRTGGQEFLVLRALPEDILREQIQRLIRQFNEKNGLQGEQARRYPFAVGSPNEEEFLQTLRDGFARVRIGKAVDDPLLLLDVPLGQVRLSGRFFDLGHGQLDAASVQVQLRLGGVWRPAGEVPGFVSNTWAAEGIAELRFPAAFDPRRDAVRVLYRYAAVRNVYALGTSIVRGSEKVYLNGRLLERDKEYTLDEESGLLVLLVEIGPTDTLRVDYEYYRGGLGASYVRNLAGLMIVYDGSTGVNGPSAGTQRAAGLAEATPFANLNQSAEAVPPVRSDGPGEATNPAGPAAMGWVVALDRVMVEAWQSWDQPLPADQAQNQTTMPETLRLVGVSAAGHLGPIQMSIDSAASWDQYPPGDNRRLPLPNEVAALQYVREGASELLLLGDANGLHVRTAGVNQGIRWRHYGLGQGLAGRRVQALAVSEEAFWIGTEAGLSRVMRTGITVGGTESSGASFDILSNWQSWDKTHGLPAGGVNALAVGAGQVWAGTASGLAQASEQELLQGLSDGRASGGVWRIWGAADGLPSARITALAWDSQGLGSGWSGTLWIGTDRGLAWLQGGRVGVAPALAGQPVSALAVGPLGSVWQGVVAATAAGVWFLPAGASPSVGNAWFPVLDADFVRAHPVKSLFVLANGGGPGVDLLFIGTQNGLWQVEESGPGGAFPQPTLVSQTAGWVVSALAGSGWDEPTATLWVGSVAQLVRQVGDSSTAAGVVGGTGERHELALWVGVTQPGGSGPDFDLTFGGSVDVPPLVSAAGDWVWQRVDTVAAGLHGDDLSRYEDLPAEGHQLRGYAVAVQVVQEGRLGQWQASASRVAPGFRSLSRAGAADELIWSVSGSVRPTSRLTVGAQVEDAVIGPTGGGDEWTTWAGPTDPNEWGSAGTGLSWRRQSQQVTIGWSAGSTVLDSTGVGFTHVGSSGPTVNLSYAASQVDDGLDGTYDRARTQWKTGLSQDFFSGTLLAALDWEQVGSWDRVFAAGNYSSQQFSTSLQWRPSAGFSWSARLVQPLGAVATLGGQEYGWQTQMGWNLLFGSGVRARLSGSAGATSVQRTGDQARQQQVQWASYLSTTSWRQWGLMWTPTASVRGVSLTPFAGLPRISTQGQVDVRGVGLQGLEVRLQGSAAQDRYPTEQRVSQQLAGSGQLSWTWAGGWRPSWGVSWSRLQFKNVLYGERQWESGQTFFKLQTPSWQGGTARWGAQATAGIGWAGGAAGYQLGIEAQGDFPSGLVMSLNGRWQQGDEIWALSAGSLGLDRSGLVAPGNWGVPAVGATGDVAALSLKRASVEVGVDVAYTWAGRWQVNGGLTFRQVWLADGQRGTARAWIPQVSVRASF